MKKSFVMFVAILLVACVSPQERRLAQQERRLAQIKQAQSNCAQYGYKPGTYEFSSCIERQSQAIETCRQDQANYQICTGTCGMANKGGTFLEITGQCAKECQHLLPRSCN